MDVPSLDIQSSVQTPGKSVKNLQTGENRLVFILQVLYRFCHGLPLSDVFLRQ